MSSETLMNLSVINLLFLLILRVSETTIVDSDPLHRSRRQLLFPNSTLLQFNAGIGTPTPAKMVNLNWAFQANFQLPWNRSQIPVDIFWANSGYDGDSRKKRDVTDEPPTERDGEYENDAQLYHFYKYVEEVLNSFGHNGKSCVLRALCQMGAEPLHTEDEEDILHEIASFVLNPTNDVIHGLTEKDEPYPYIEAYKRGHDGQDCSRIYDNCSTSLIDMFTRLHDSAS